MNTKGILPAVLLLVGTMLSELGYAEFNENGNGVATSNNSQNTSEQSSQQNLKRGPSGQNCTGTSPNSFPQNPASSPFSIGQLGACVNPTACNINNATLKSKIADRYCQDANKATCDANDDCLPLPDCKGRVNGTASSIVLTNCQNTGPSLCASAGGGIYCLCNAEIAANTQIKCGCECTTKTLP
ncbi:TPA: hypothetical protein JA361_07245 [Legionella pneumophila]|nr:hypothetical protein [Legionella pneumophila]HAT8182042.1 hypothetical protein [Legionella pneumophila]